MPVSVVCDSTANVVNAALRESLNGGSGGGSCSSAAAAATAAETKAIVAGGVTGAVAMTTTGTTDTECLQNKLVASTKRVLLTTIEYEEANGYGQSVLESMKTKYVVLKSNATTINNNGNLENGRGVSTATCSSSNNGIAAVCSSDAIAFNYNDTGANGNHNHNTDANGNVSLIAKRSMPNELPVPKKILFSREEVRIGWKNPARKWQVGVGMMNVGNTCYLNSTLQAIFHVPSMANWLLSDGPHREQCESADAGCIICAMAKTLLASQTSQSAIRPYLVYSKLRSICKHLVMGHQEDAHEFLRYLVEAMEKSYLARFRNFKDLDQYSKETTPLNQILGGYLRSAVRCPACSHVSVTFQHFQDLLLDIRKSDSIEDALEGYFSRERLEDMGYKCESCKKKVSATKQFTLERAPISLCIQLKRFSMLGAKLSKQINIKPRLDLTKFSSRKLASEPLSYRLVAMVTHLGASQHCGHYTAIGITESGTYYNYDDSYVRPISIQNVCSTNAYIIFYELDNSAPRQAICTQICAAETKENYPKPNGYMISATPRGPIAQRIIGPQLPPTTAKCYTTAMNGITTFAGNTIGTRFGVQRPSGIPISNNNANSKIMIHFKSNNAVMQSTATSSTATNAPSMPCVLNGNSANQNITSTTIMNGLLTGTGNFQESACTKSALAGRTDQEQDAAATNGNDNGNGDGSHEIAAEDENEISSTSDVNRISTVATLPNMPILFTNISACDEAGGKANLAPQNGRSPTALMPQVKSLVPYGYEGSEDEEASNSEPKRAKLTTVISEYNGMNPRKRRNSSCSSNSATSVHDYRDENDEDEQRPTNCVKLKRSNTSTATASIGIQSNVTLKSPIMATNGPVVISANHIANNTINGTFTQSNAKQKTDAIDQIFNFQKRNVSSNGPTTAANVTVPVNGNNSPNSHNGNVDHTKPLASAKNQFAVSSTTTLGVRHSPDVVMNGAENDVSNDSRSQSPAMRTPPPPPIISGMYSTPSSSMEDKLKTGYWQVVTMSHVSECISPPDEDRSLRNPKNPFGSKSTSDLFVRRPKGNMDQHTVERASTYPGNGYQRDCASDSAINELLRHSHRGYGAPVFSWNGEQADIDREVKDEDREMRQRDWDDEQENDMDRGRQKKTKVPPAPSMRTLGYNPFQEQENQRRWSTQHAGIGSGVGGGSGSGNGSIQRFQSDHFRHQFLRSKMQFQRFSPKYQRQSLPPPHQQRSSVSGLSAAGVNNAGCFSRRDS